MYKTLSILALWAFSLAMFAETFPSFEISYDAKDGTGEEKTGQDPYEGSAPITATFHVSFYNADDWTVKYEWRFCHEDGSLDDPYMIRYEESPVIVFTQGGMDKIALYVTFSKEGHQPIVCTGEYWKVEKTPLTIKTSESELSMPNAFSPNGDSRNDTYKPKSFTSIVEFRAIIFNRWGQKLYEWNDVTADGWDGTFNGSPVKQGAYFCLVNAKGADGRIFQFKKDVNLLRTYDENYEENGSGELK